jgi:CheY-like chemotaxis protein/two-component sensor histidine kinase
VTQRAVLAQLLARLEEDLRGAGQGESAQLRLQVEEGAPEKLITDERKVLLALNNIVRYALHASSDGRVEVTVGRAAGNALPAFLGGSAPGAPRPEGYLKVSVRHCGSEFEKARLADLFRELDEIDPAVSEQIRGVHLGLSLARRLLESLGGRVWVERPGRGEVVAVVLLPLQREAEEEEGATWPAASAAPGPEPAVAAREEKGTVLVVEDNPFNRSFLRVILGHMGYHVEEADNGEEGVRRAGQLQPDLVLMDMMMPVLDGFQATERLKADPVTRGIPILAMTALSLEKDRRRARQAGCDDFLAMPSPREVVEERIARWIATGRGREAKRGEGR